MAYKRSGVRVSLAPPKFMKTKHKDLDDILPYLPRHSYSKLSDPMEPVSLIIIGKKHHLIDTFKLAGWYLADKITLTSSVDAALASLFNKSYKTGPMWTSYLSGKKHQIGFERPTGANTFRHRHHLRLWKTKFNLKDEPVWLGTISYDKSIGTVTSKLIPTHHISPTLNSEEDFLADTLYIKKPHYVELGNSEEGQINTGDNYFWNGKALVVDLSRAKPS